MASKGIKLSAARGIRVRGVARLMPVKAGAAIAARRAKGSKTGRMERVAIVENVEVLLRWLLKANAEGGGFSRTQRTEHIQNGQTSKKWSKFHHISMFPESPCIERHSRVLVSKRPLGVTLPNIVQDPKDLLRRLHSYRVRSKFMERKKEVVLQKTSTKPTSSISIQYKISVLWCFTINALFD